MKLLKSLKDYAIVTVGTFVVSIAIYFFMLPSHISVGSGAALAMVLSNFIPLSVSTITLIMNVGLLILGFLLIGPEFGAKTVYSTILLPVFLAAWEVILPNQPSIMGIGLSVLFSHNASSGGLDIVAKIMNKYLKMEVGKAMSLSGIVVALSSILCYDTKTVVLSVLGTFFGGIVVDYFIFGINIKRRVCVISKELDTIVNFVLHDLHSGATLYNSTGAYDKTPRTEMITIVDKNEYRQLMDFIHKTDPKAFVTVYSVSDMRYIPKK